MFPNHTIDFWQMHGFWFLIGIAVFPRITMFFFTAVSTVFAGPLFWVGWIFAPHLTVAIIATILYWDTNPMLCVVSWFCAFSGESTEKKIVMKAKKRGKGMTRYKKKAKGWVPFEKANLPPGAEKAYRGYEPDEVWLNNFYQVMVRRFDTNGIEMTHLSIKRIDRSPIRDWRDLQRIKNEILGPQIEAVELYPAEDRLVDTSNQYHLWALPPEMAFPFGYGDRLVTEGSMDNSKQRQFDEKPNNLVQAEDLKSS